MKTNIQIGFRIAGSFFISFILATAESLDWPEPVEVKIGEILKIKEEAMAFPSMRSEDGIIGKRTEKLIDELGKLITEASLILQLEEREGEDIKAKIALWAVDQKKRPEEYKRFAKYYVNKPSWDEAAEYFSRVPMRQPVDPFAVPKKPGDYVPRPGAWSPNLVDEEDQKEKFRLILEYCFFVPPTGIRFDNDLYRINMISALLALDHHEKSLVVMASDAEMALFAENRHGEDKKRTSNSYVPLRFMARVNTDRSFVLISKIRTNGMAEEKIQIVFKDLWKDQYVVEKFQESKKSFDAWQAIAEKSREAPEQRQFAEWLRSFDPPKDPSTDE